MKRFEKIIHDRDELFKEYTDLYFSYEKYNITKSSLKPEVIQNVVKSLESTYNSLCEKIDSVIDLMILGQIVKLEYSNKEYIEIYNRDKLDIIIIACDLHNDSITIFNNEDGNMESKITTLKDIKFNFARMITKLKSRNEWLNQEIQE